MKLLIDIGNSALHWAQSDGGEPGTPYRRDYTDDPVPAADWDVLPDPAQVWIASVARPLVTAAVIDWCRNRWGVEPRVAGASRAALGVENGYADPAQLGVDRWLGLVGAWRLGLAPCCIADCGSAITIDVLDGAGRHLGGLILPGLRMMECALVDNTAGIHVPESSEDPADFLGRNTADAIRGGGLLAAAGSIERATALAGAHIGETVRVVITGGDGQRVAARMAGAVQHVPDLVLRGLAAMSETLE